MTLLSSLRLRPVLVILFVLQFSPVEAFSNGSTSLTGEILFPGRGPLTRALVTINGHGYYKTVTPRIDGSFEFDNLPAGDYVIEVIYPGYEVGRLEIRWSPAEVRRVTVPLGRPTNQDRLPIGKDPTTTVTDLKVPSKALKEIGKAQERSRQSDYEGAIKHLRKALGIYSVHSGAWNNLGAAYLKVGRDVEAEAAFKNALANDPRCVQALRNLGLLYFVQGKNNEAIGPLKASLENDSTDYRAHTYLAVALYRAGRYSESAIWLYKALDAKPDFTDAVYQMAVVQFKLGDFQAAAQAADRYLALSPQGEYAEKARQLRTFVGGQTSEPAE